MSGFRKLKVYTKHRPGRWRNYTTVPEIRLEGRWLEELGFKQGDQVQIKQERNKLTITLYHEKE